MLEAAPGHCCRCRRKLTDAELLFDLQGQELCDRCRIEERRHLPQVGEPDPEALEYINRVFRFIPEDTQFHRYKKDPIGLRQLIMEEADAIRKQARFRETVVRAVERATGTSRERIMADVAIHSAGNK